MKWEDFETSQHTDRVGNIAYKETNIECPECGAFLFRCEDIVLATYPPKRLYLCKKCGWHRSN